MRRVILIHSMICLASIVSVQTMALGEELQLTNNTEHDSRAQIHNGQVVWYGHDGSDNEIFLPTASTPSRPRFERAPVAGGELREGDGIRWR